MDALLIYAIEWLPLFVLIGMLLFIVMRTGLPKNYSAMASAQLDEIRRQNAILERIATALEKGTTRLP